MKMFLTKAIILKANKVICLFPLKKKVRLLTMYLNQVSYFLCRANWTITGPT